MIKKYTIQKKKVNKYAKQRSDSYTLRKEEIPLAEDERIIYLYKKDRNNTIYEVTNVSYDIRINDNWITIIRYDSSHGFLHRHMRVSLDNSTDTATTLGVITQGTHADWLTWAIDDIKANFSDYKKEFLIRSNMVSIDNDESGQVL